ncbi:MAG: hypothetical protein WCL14_02940 [Bacteroidota bacterium]
MLEIIIAILLSLGIKSDGSDIKILSDSVSPTGTEVVTFYDGSNGNQYSIGGTEQSGWGIINSNPTPTISASGDLLK